MKSALLTIAMFLLTISAQAKTPDNFKPMFPINTQPENVMSTTAEQEKSDMEAQRHYSNICCIGYGYYCYLPGRYPVGWDCYCYYRGYYYDGWVCRY